MTDADDIQLLIYGVLFLVLGALCLGFVYGGQQGSVETPEQTRLIFMRPRQTVAAPGGESDG